MSAAFDEIILEWEKSFANIRIYENLDVLFPYLRLTRVNPGKENDKWRSPFKMDGSNPRYKNSEKTVVNRSDFRFREQGNFNEGVFMVSKYQSDNKLATILDAYSRISDVLHLDMPKPDSEEVRKKVSQINTDNDLLATLNDYFVWHLNTLKHHRVAEVRTYLKKERQFSDDQIRQLSFGFVPEWDKVERFITMEKHFRKEDLDRLCKVRNDDNYTSVGRYNVLSIPYVCGGQLKGFLFRSIAPGRQPKYIANTSLDRKSVFFNMPEKAEDIVVVEGEIDALKLTAEGIPQCVAIGGSEISGERRHQLEDAFRRGVRRIFLCFDLDPDRDNPSLPDLASRHRHIMRTIHTIKDVNPDFDAIYVTMLPYVCDPDEYVRHNGPARFCDLLRASRPYWRYLCDFFEQK